MADLSFLEKFYSEHHRDTFHYLVDQNKEPESWQVGQADGRRAH